MKLVKKPGRISEPESNADKMVFAAAGLLILLVFIVYSGAVNNNFVGWDDNEYVVDNPLVRNEKGPGFQEIFSTVVSLNYHPLTILSLSLNNNICKDCPNGISAKPFIINNIILHTLNTVIVFILIYILFRKNLLMAFLVAAIFGIHPMHVESVAWISGRKDVLSSFFFLTGLITYIYYLKSTKGKYLWLLSTFLLFIFACLSKTTAVIFPVVAILLHYFINGEEKSEYGFREFFKAFSVSKLMPLLPFFAISVFLGLMAVKIQNGENFLGLFRFIKEPEDVVNIVGPFSVMQRVLIASYGFMVYLLKFIIPVNQSPFYPYPDPAEFSQGSFSLIIWLSFIGIIVTIFMVIYSMKRTRLFLFCFGFSFVTLALTLQFISVGKAIMAERYTYLPYIGLAIVPALYITQSRDKTRKLLYILSGLFIIILLILARNQVKTWHDSETLWTQVIKRHPDLELARRARGKYYYMLSAHATNQKDKVILENKAIADFRIAISEKTSSADVYEGMGVILQSRKEFKTALQFLNIAVKLNPEKGRTYYNRAMIYDQLNMKEEAILDYESALRFDPDMELEILKNRSVLYIETGRYDKAIEDLNELIRIDGKDFTNYYNRAFSKVMIKDYDGAIIDYKIVLLLNPEDRATREQLSVLQQYQKKK